MASSKVEGTPDLFGQQGIISVTDSQKEEARVMSRVFAVLE